MIGQSDDTDVQMRASADQFTDPIRLGHQFGLGR